VIGWIVVVVAGGWLILSVASLIMVTRGARAVKKTAQNLGSNFAASTAAANVVDTSDPMRDTKVDHSLKIVEVQKRVVSEEMEKVAEHARFDIINHPLDTIEMMASNARDMLDPERHNKPKSDSDNGNNTISGEIINQKELCTLTLLTQRLKTLFA